MAAHTFNDTRQNDDDDDDNQGGYLSASAFVCWSVSRSI